MTEYIEGITSINNLLNKIRTSKQNLNSYKLDTNKKVKGIQYLEKIDIGVHPFTFTIDNI